MHRHHTSATFTIGYFLTVFEATDGRCDHHSGNNNSDGAHRPPAARTTAPSPMTTIFSHQRRRCGRLLIM
jgi:hypothetical protein